MIYKWAIFAMLVARSQQYMKKSDIMALQQSGENRGRRETWRNMRFNMGMFDQTFGDLW